MQPELKPRRGRPTEVDRHALALVALRLFERRGFDDVTMDDIAQAARVSRRTLFRHYPSKADLVWDGIDEVLRGVRARAAELPPRASLADVMSALFAEGLQQLDDPVLAKMARRRLRLIAAAPSLLTHPTLDRLQAVLADAIEARHGASALPPSLVARSLFAVGFSSLLWWAASEGPLTALEAIQVGLEGVASARAGNRTLSFGK